MLSSLKDDKNRTSLQTYFHMIQAGYKHNRDIKSKLMRRKFHKTVSLLIRQTVTDNTQKFFSETNVM